MRVKTFLSTTRLYSNHKSYFRKKNNMKTILTTFILLISLNFFAQDVPDKYQDIWTECNEGDPKKVHKKLDKLIKKNPNDPWLYWMKGNVGFSYGPENNKYFEKAIQLDSTFAAAYYSLAINIFEEDENSQLKKEVLYTKAIKYSKEPISYYFTARSDLYIEMKKFDLALIDAEQARKIEDIDQFEANRVYIYALNGLNRDKDLKAFLFSNDVINGGMAGSDYYILVGSLYEKYKMKNKACEAYTVGLNEIEFMRDMYETPEEFEKAYGEDFKFFQEKLKACN